MQQFKLSESIAARRYFYLHLVDASDGLTPETGEAGDRPQISKNGAGFGNTSATLTAIGNGAYYVALTTGELDTLGAIMVRYASANTAEFQDIAYVVAYDAYDAATQGLTNLDVAVSTRAVESTVAKDATVAKEATVVVVSGNVDIINAKVSGVKAKTDNLPADPADQSEMETTIMAAQANVDAAIETAHNITDGLIAVLGASIPADLGDVPTAIELNTEHGAGKYDQAGGMGGYTVSGGELIWRMDEKLLLLKTAKETLESVKAIDRSLPEGAVANIDIEVGRLIETVNNAIALIISSASDLRRLDAKTISGKDIMGNFDRLREDASDIKKIVTMELSDDKLEELDNEEDDSSRNKQKD